MQLPPEYAEVPPCFVDTKKSKCPSHEIYTIDQTRTPSPFSEETEWLDSTISEEFHPWSAYHANGDREINERHATDVALLPVFHEQAHSAAMMMHSMNTVSSALKFLNPQQTPVLVADQPLYALLKQLQYMHPNTLGDDKLFVMMGGLHIEMAGLKVIGQWLNNSGWVNALVQANVTTKGRSESMLSASHVTRTRYAHQVRIRIKSRLFGTLSMTLSVTR